MIFRPHHNPAGLSPNWIKTIPVMLLWPVRTRDQNVAIRYSNKLMIEQVRSIEEGCGPIDLIDNPAPEANFSQWLATRARRIARQPAIDTALQQGPRFYHRGMLILTFLTMMLGAITTLKSFARIGSELNIFWVLLLLLGFNALSLVLWIVFTVGLRGSGNGVIAPLFNRAIHRWLPNRLNTPAHAANRAWLRVRFEGPAARWHLGRITHWAWMSYVVGGWLCLLLLLATRQFDFVWESTLLGGDSFVSLTRAMAAPLQTLGLPTPSEAQILASQTGQLPGDPADARRLWGWFLLLCILFYGFFPRLLAWLFCILQEKRLQNRFQLPLTETYYLTLQQQLWPRASATVVLDQDPAPGEPKHPTHTSSTPESPPDDAIWVGLELTGAHAKRKVRTNVVDRPSLLNALTLLDDNSAQPLVIAADAARPPDRGVERFIRQLLAKRNPNSTWLVLYIDGRQITTQQQENWARLVSVTDFSPSHIMPMNPHAV